MDTDHSEYPGLHSSTEELKRSKVLIAQMDQVVQETKELLAEGRRLLSDPIEQKNCLEVNSCPPK